MKKWTVVAAALFCCACTELPYMEDEAPKRPVNRRPLTTEVSLKVAGESADSIDIFVYDDDRLRRLDTYQRSLISGNVLKVASTSGPKIMAFVMNGRQGRYLWTANNSFSYMEGLEAEFARDRSASPVSAGVCRIDGKSGGSEVTVTPIMSRIVLRSIRADFKGRAYEGEHLTDVRVYLTNVSSVCRIIQEKDFVTRGTLNTGRLSEEDMARMDEPSMLMQALPGSIGKDFIEPGVTLYCYPNTNEKEGLGAPFTRLVIEGRIEGRLWYWPIDINREGCCWVEGTPGVERGKSYVYDITIRRTGSTDPDTAVSLTSVEVGGIVEPWTEEEKRDEIF